MVGFGVVLGVQRDLLEVLHGHVADLLRRVLHGEEVVVAALGIDPVAGSNHAIGGERGDYVVARRRGGQPETRGHFALHIKLNAGIVEVLRNQYVADIMQARAIFCAMSLATW